MVLYVVLVVIHRLNKNAVKVVIVVNADLNRHKESDMIERDMKEMTLRDFYNSSDAVLASFIREDISHYYDMKLDNSQVGITALERFKDSLFMKTISGDTDERR